MWEAPTNYSESGNSGHGLQTKAVPTASTAKVRFSESLATKPQIILKNIEPMQILVHAAAQRRHFVRRSVLRRMPRRAGKVKTELSCTPQRTWDGDWDWDHWVAAELN